METPIAALYPQKLAVELLIMPTSTQIKKALSGLGIATLLYEACRWKNLDSDWTTAGYLWPRSVKKEYFRNRIIWITGASSGIGKALCYYLVSLKVNIKLIISSRRQQVLEDLKHDLITKNRNAIYSTDIYVLPMDLTKKTVKYYRKQYESIKEYFDVSSIDILINNAGIGMRSEFQKFHAKNSMDMLQTNLVSPIILTQLVLDDIINDNKNDKLKPFGHICNVGSLIAYLLVAQQTTYNATKSGLLAFGTSLALELEGIDDVTITDVLPGIAFTITVFVHCVFVSCFGV